MSRLACPKTKPIRSAKLRDAAKDAPHCMACQKPNEGDVVGCHPPFKLGYGGGMGHKGNDLLAYCCGFCHSQIDGREGDFSARDRQERWLDAFYWSTVWLVTTGRLK